jgi:hypothetical protein
VLCDLAVADAAEAASIGVMTASATGLAQRRDLCDDGDRKTLDERAPRPIHGLRDHHPARSAT